MPSEAAVRDAPDSNLSGKTGEDRWGGEERRTRPRLRTLVLISLIGAYFASLLLIYVEFSLVQSGEYTSILMPLALVAVGLGAVLGLGYIYINRHFINPLEEMVMRLRSAPSDVIAPNLGLDVNSAGEIGAVPQRHF